MIKHIFIFCLIISSGTVITGPLNTLCMRGLKMRSIDIMSAVPQILARFHSARVSPELAGKSLQAISDEENALVLKILSLKEMAYDIPEYGSPRGLNRKSYTIKNYEKTEHTLYQKLDQLRRYKKTLES